MTYEEWIAENVDRGYGKCREVVGRMVRAFPDLRRACGFYHCPAWGRREHWWCVDREGKVVDPTRAQFPSAEPGLGVNRYEELDLTNPADRARIPTGVCMDCGGPVYGGDTFCDATCEEQTMAYLGMERNPETGNWRNV